MTLYRSLTYDVPLSPPVRNQAWVAERPGDWRLVMFPGTPARKYLFERMLRTAPADLETVLVMRPGFGRGHDRVYPDFRDQVAAAAPFLGGDKKVIAMGVSYGGELALQALIDNPSVVKGAVTVAALVSEPRNWVHPFYRLGGLGLVNGLLPRSARHTHAEITGRRSQIASLMKKLRDVAAPVTILHGDADHLVAFADAEKLHAAFAPGADVALRKVHGGTHFLEYQFPAHVFDEAKKVISRAERK